MSERSPNLSSVDVFVEWAKARLDEMGANVKVSDFGKVGIVALRDGLSRQEWCILPFIVLFSSCVLATHAGESKFDDGVWRKRYWRAKGRRCDKAPGTANR
jgi:hypothetical protein